MSIEISRETEFSIDSLTSTETLLKKVEQLEEQDFSLLHLSASFESLDKVQSVLLALRASNVACVLLIQPPVGTPSRVEVCGVVDLLRDWDQLLLENILRLASQWIPQKYLELLQREATIEKKWFQEWVTAISDPRVAKYPSLPWRSFVRRTVSENHDFAIKLLAPDLERESMDESDVDNLVQGFLDRKKQAVCIFPKRWKRDGNTTN